MGWRGVTGWCLLVVGLVLSGCGGGDDEGVVGSSVPAGASAAPVPGAGEEFDGCGLVEQGDASGLLGGSVRSASKPSGGVAAATCVWETTSGPARALQLVVTRGDGFFAPGSFEGDESFEALEGVGDEAFTVAPGGVLQLHVRAGGFSVVLSVDGVDEETVKARLVRLGGRIAEEL